MKKKKGERKLFDLLCDLENALYAEDDWYSVIRKDVEESYDEVEFLLDEWEKMFKKDKEKNA